MDSPRDDKALGNWTNLSETTFLLTRRNLSGRLSRANLTPERELPFAGHPTLGSCQVWLNSGGAPKQSYIVQECGVGLIRIKRDGERLAFAAPPLRRSGPVEPDAGEDRTRAAHQAPMRSRPHNGSTTGPAGSR